MRVQNILDIQNKQKSGNNRYRYISDTMGRSVSTEKLREAIIWSELLGKPKSKRRKRR